MSADDVRAAQLDNTRRLQRWRWLAIAAVLPVALLFWGNACYTWNHFLDWRSCTPGDGPMLETDVFVQFREVAHLKVMQTGDPIRLTFELAGPNPIEGVELRTHSGRCNALLRDVHLVRL